MVGYKIMIQLIIIILIIAHINIGFQILKKCIQMKNYLYIN